MTIWKEIGYSWRVLKRKPGFAMAVILCLGLGIGAVTAVFSVINGVTMRFMPYERPGRIVFLVRADDSGSRVPAVSARYFLDWKERNTSFSDMAAYQRYEPHTGWAGWAETQENLMGLQGMIVTPNFFSVLGMRTLLGRALTDSDQGLPVIVLSRQVWRDKFAEDPQIIGRSILLGGRAREVIGIAAHNYRFFPTYYGAALNRSVGYWIPVSRSFESETRTSWNYAALARLKHGTTIAQAQADIDRITRLQHKQYVDDFPKDIRMLVQSMPQTLVGPIRSVTFLILAAAAFVLMIACANVINLFLVHSMKRKTEMAVRSALGSSRWRIIRQLICENMVLVLLGGLLGILVAQWGMDVLLGLAPRNLPGVDEICLDARVLAISLMVTLLCAFVVGLIPGIPASRLNLASVLKGFGTRATSGFGEHRTIRWVVVSEIVLSFTLIIGASLLIRSYLRLMQVELGFQSGHVLTLRLSGPELTNRHDELLERLQTLPGVELAASSTGLPLSGELSDSRLVSPVPEEEAPESQPVSYVRTVSTDYFRVLGASLARGRYFTMQDSKNSSPVVIVNEALARRLWPEADFIGQLMDFGDGTRIFYDGSGETLVQRRVVGVVRNIRYEGPDVDPPLEAFIPFAQRTRSHYVLSVALRCRGNPTGLMQAVRREVCSVDDSFKIESMSTIEGFYSELTAHRRFLMAMFSVFAAVAFTLAVIGIYGVVAFTVSMRIREMGIRIAFGAQRRDILRLVMKRAAGLTMTGVGFGLLGAFVLRKVIANQLFGISPLDPLALAVGLLLVILVPLAASYIPARRAAKIDPMEALRYE
ncbi:MAG: ABC transporter permease [Sedimentisphaerales bacterium]